MYAFGKGVPEDDAEAVKWFRLAAEQGHEGARLFLGAMYESGAGVPESHVKAYAWYSVAAAQGETRSRDSKNRLAETMTGSQIAEAQALALEYWTQYAEPFRQVGFRSRQIDRNFAFEGGFQRWRQA